jgi:hypothetical protein
VNFEHSGFPGIDEGDHNLVCRLIRDEARAHIALQDATDGEQPYTGPCSSRPLPAPHDERATAMGIGQCVVLGLARVDFEGECIIWFNPLAEGDEYPWVPWTTAYNAMLLEHFRGIRAWAGSAKASREQFRAVVGDVDKHMN